MKTMYVTMKMAREEAVETQAFKDLAYFDYDDEVETWTEGNDLYVKMPSRSKFHRDFIREGYEVVGCDLVD